MSSIPKDTSFEKKRRVRGNKVLILAALGIVAVGLVISIPFLKQDAENKGDVAPDFSLVDIDGNNFTLSNHLGKVIVLNFMATWCPACKSEIPELESVWALYNETIVIASIDIDLFETHEEIRAFRDSYLNANWIWMKDTANVKEVYEVFSIPKTVVIDKNGIIAYTHMDEVGASTLINEIQMLLG